MMIEVELTEKQVGLLFPALKEAESVYTKEGNWKACNAITSLYTSLHTQIYTYGQMEG